MWQVHRSVAYTSPHLLNTDLTNTSTDPRISIQVDSTPSSLNCGSGWTTTTLAGFPAYYADRPGQGVGTWRLGTTKAAYLISYDVPWVYSSRIPPLDDVYPTPPTLEVMVAKRHLLEQILSFFTPAAAQPVFCRSK
jgi:hypothetical protein